MAKNKAGGGASSTQQMRPLPSTATSQPLPDTLAGAMDLRKTTAPRPVFVDVSAHFSRTLILEWRKPSIKEIYRVADDAVALMRRYPLWSEQLAVHVATLAACHVAPSPGGLAPAYFYAQIADAEDSAELWQMLMDKLGREYPSLLQTSLPLVQELLDLCVQYLHRHPDELGHLSADVMSELHDMAARRSKIT